MLSRRQFIFLYTGVILLFCSILYLLSDNLVAAPRAKIRNEYSIISHTEKVKRFGSTFLLVIIMSHSNDSTTRSAIRESWLRLSAKGVSQVRHLFSIGTHGLSTSELRQLYDEQEHYDDLLLLNSHVDTYENLARKTANSLKVAIDEVTFDYVLKVDSDSFVRLGSFIKALKDISHPMLYWGFLDGRAKPFRKGKWKEKDWILCDRYLPYQLGGGYVLSFRLASFIASNIDLLKYYRSEDVSVGAWLAGLDVKYIHDPRFDTEFRSRGCSNQYLITHKQNASALKHLFENVRDYGHLCTKEVKLRPSSKFWIDFVLLVIPMLLSLTLMSQYVFILVGCQVICIISVIFLFFCEYHSYNKERPPFQQVINQVIAPEMGPTMFFTYLRSMLMVYTCIAILAVDFQVFPRRFAKTETFGHSVMDIGSSAFVFVMGAAETIRLTRKDSSRASLRSLVRSSRMTLVLVGIGMCRSLILPLLNYQRHVTEYGTHWNFFFTLAAIKAFSIMHSLVCRGNFSLLLGVLFSAIHEYLLTGLGYKIWILSDAARDTWISANREGIYSILGYLALYCFGYRIGQIAAPSGCVRLKAYFWLTVKIFILSVVFFILQKCPLEYYFGQPSRRLMNLPFIFSMNALFTFALAMFLLVQFCTLIGWAARVPSFHLEETATNNKLFPCILSALNEKGFLVFFFLFSNLFTGLLNLSIDTVSVTDPILATAVIGAYSASCIAMTFYISRTTHNKDDGEAQSPVGRLLRLIFSS